VNLEYILDGDEEIILRDSKNSQEFKLNIKSGAKDIRIGYILMPGVTYAISVIAFGSLLAQAASSMQLDVPFNTGFIILLLSLVMLVVIWHKWGLLSKGATIRLNNKEKVCIVCGHNTKTFDDLVDRIKRKLPA